MQQFQMEKMSWVDGLKLHTLQISITIEHKSLSVFMKVDGMTKSEP